MFEILVFFHSIIRWFVLISLLYAIFRAGRGFLKKSVFGKVDNQIRHWTATIAHIQLITGVLLYVKSPTINFFWKNVGLMIQNLEATFWGLIHGVLMLIAIILITIGSAMAKRKQADNEKFGTMFFYFLLALILILIAIPWPFSPLASRPY